MNRDKTGKSRGEVVDLSVVLKQPHRAGRRDPESRLLGYALGRLLERGLIDGQQYQAGERWSAVVASYRRQLLSAPSGSTRSGEMAERVSSGFAPWEGEVREIDPEQAEKDRQSLKSKYDCCFENLCALGRVLHRQHAIINAVRKVCVDDRDPSENEVGDLRLGLNCLVRFLLLKEEGRR